MDGAVGVTQCPIPPGASFVYNFTIRPDQSGTFWYHAHSGVSRADGLYGGLVVHSPVPKFTVRSLMARAGSKDSWPHSYDEDLLVLIGDWYHRPGHDVLAWYMRAGSFGNEVCLISITWGLGGNCAFADIIVTFADIIVSLFPTLFWSMALASLTVQWQYLRGHWTALRKRRTYQS